MTTTDEARVTDEEIARFVSEAREYAVAKKNPTANQSVVIVALADRLAAREAEMVALLEATHEYQSTDYCDGAEGDEPLSDECYDEKPPCWSHRAAALLTKLRHPMTDRPAQCNCAMGADVKTCDVFERDEGCFKCGHDEVCHAPSAPPERPGERATTHGGTCPWCQCWTADVAGPNDKEGT